MQIPKAQRAVGEFIVLPYASFCKSGLIFILRKLAERSVVLPPFPSPVRAQQKNSGSSRISAALGTKPR